MSPASKSLFVFFFIALPIAVVNTQAQGTLPASDKTCGLRPSAHAFIFYCLRPSNDFLDFAVELSLSSPYDVYIVPDDLTYVWADAAKYPSVKWTIIPTSTVLAANFSHSSNCFPFDKPRNESVWAMDRALTLAASSEFTDKYCRMWLIEDDVFIPSVAAAIHVDKLASDDYDLISTSIINPFKGKLGEYHWQLFKNSMHRFPIPEDLWTYFMANAVALSPRFLKMLRTFAAINGQLLYSEPMFPTFTTVWNLRHLALDDLHMLWRNNGGVNYSWKEFSEHPMWWYHPMKNETLRKQFRAQLYPDLNSLQLGEPTSNSTEETKEPTFAWHSKVGELKNRTLSPGTSSNQPRTTQGRPQLPQKQSNRHVPVPVKPIKRQGGPRP